MARTALFVCFAPENITNPEFVTKPFCDWKNACGGERGALNRHNKSDTHVIAVQSADDFLQVCHQNRKSVKEYLSQAYAEKIRRNRAALLCILDVIMALAERAIPLRGSSNKATGQEDSNFNFFIKWKAQDNPEFAAFLKNAPRNARYLSPQIQNQLIDCMAKVIRKYIVEEAMKVDFFSVIADETCDASTTEQMSVCIRYIRSDGSGKIEVSEDFLGFVQLKETNAAAITDKLLTKLSEWNLELSKLRGKGFDGASVMSGHVSGVTTRIQQALPKAKYFTHCRSHCLNLVIVSSCNNVPEVKNFMDAFRKLSVFVNSSHKRKSILKSNISEKSTLELLTDLDVHDEELHIASNRRQGLPTLCETRWLSRVDSLSVLLGKYDQLKNALEEISDDSSAESKSDANAYLKKMCQFPFILTATMTQHILAILRPLSLGLQSKKCDLVEAYEECQIIIAMIRDERDKFHEVFLNATAILKKTYGDSEEPEIQRASANKRHSHRANAQLRISTRLTTTTPSLIMSCPI